MYQVGEENYHHSRVMRFIGEPYYKPEQIKGFGVSIMKQVEEAVKTFGLTITGLEDIILEMTFKVLGIPMLSKVMESTDETTLSDAITVIKTRMELLNNTMTTDGLLVKDIEETFEKPVVNATGIDPLLKFVMQYVAAAANVPMTKLWGQQVGTLAGATETTGDWQDTVRNYQESLSDELEKVIEYIVASLNNGIIPEDFDWNWNPARSESNKERVEIDAKFNESLTKLYEAGLLSFDESRNAIDGGAREIVIDKTFMQEPTDEENK
jgi:phage-related protein (TIGR01555 family)